jgi:hypothetical protein
MKRGKREKCKTCGSILSAWEMGTCGCKTPLAETHREILYTIACRASGVLHARDFVRNAERDHHLFLDSATAIATLATDPRFCWAGRGVYGLYRHGPLPGPRNLEQAARLILIAAGRKLTQPMVDFCLKQLGYRYNVASLRNAVAQSNDISWDRYGGWDHAHGEAAELALRAQLRIVPPRQKAAWIWLRDETNKQVRTSLAKRNVHLRAFADSRNFGMNWEL